VKSPAARRDGHAALAGAQFGADDAERQWRRFGLAVGLLGARGWAGAAARAAVWRVLICSTSARSA
jgi:hypothetical protein